MIHIYRYDKKFQFSHAIIYHPKKFNFSYAIIYHHMKNRHNVTTKIHQVVSLRKSDILSKPPFIYLA